MKRYNKQKSFTLIELMTVIGIIAILAGLMLVGYNVFFNEANIGSSMRFDSSIHHSLGYALVGDWKLDDNAANSTVVDTSGNGNDGTFYSSSTEDNTANHSVDGANNRALEFDGVDDHLELSSSITLSKNNAAISIWFKIYQTMDDNYGYRQNLLNAGSKYSGFLSFKNNGTLRAEGATNDDIWSDIFNVLDLNKWTHVVLSAKNASVDTYINGKLKNATSVISDFKIDNFSAPTECLVNGSIDQVRVYKAALSVSQVKQQYYTGLERLYKKNMISEKEYKERIRHF